MTTIVELVRAEHPLVAVVFVTYGGWRHTRKALEALAEHTHLPYETIIVDNCSPDDTRERLQQIVRGAVVVLADRNLGFGAACNLGATKACAPVICFLNTDAFVERGWVEPLLAALEGDRVGVAVPQIMHTNGLVQEAASIVGRDGLTHAVGDGEDAASIAYAWGRRADYGSGACLVVRRADFNAVGGFDVGYAGGYYEDVDLCFALARRGLDTIYVPASRVAHVRHGVFGASAPEHMVANRRRFKERWSSELAFRPPLSDLTRLPHRAVAARDARTTDRILVIDDRVPHRDRGSGDPRTALLLDELATLWPRARVTLAATSSENADRYAPSLLQHGIEVACGVDDWGKWFDSRRFHYDIVIISRPPNIERFSLYVDRTQPQALFVYDMEALFFRRVERQIPYLPPDKVEAALREADAYRRVEMDAIARADAVFCVSPEEEAFTHSVAPDTPVWVLPVPVDVENRPVGFDARGGVVFFGGFMSGPGSPNEDALLHLVEEIMPRLWETDPQILLHVVGANPTPDVLALAGDRINVVGFVRDPGPWLRQARLHIAPLRFGSGIKLKLLDTMAVGLPFVTTTVGAEGLHLGGLEDVLVSDTAFGIARAALRLYHDPVAWSAAQAELVAVVKEHFSRERYRETLVAAMALLGVSPPAPALVRPLRRAEALR